MLSRQHFDEQAGEVFRLANRIPANFPEHERVKNAAMQYREQGVKAARNGQVQEAATALDHLIRLRREVEEQWPQRR